MTSSEVKSEENSRRSETFAVITGASSGIGWEFAVQLAKRKTNLVLVARRKDRLEALASQLSAEHSITVRTLALDLSEPQSAQELFKYCQENGISVGLLVNNAGTGVYRSLIEDDPERIRKNLELNVITPTLLTALFARNASRGQRPSLKAVINVASTAAFQPVPGLSVYAASKSYVLNFSEAADHELREIGVRVLTVCPGPTRTELLQHLKLDERRTRLTFHEPARIVRETLEGLDAGKNLVIPGLLNKLMALTAQLAPRGLVVKVAAEAIDASATEPSDV